MYYISDNMKCYFFKFQLFGGFTEFLLSKCKCEALETCQCRQRKQELFPLIGSYITSHALYFDPCSRGKLPHSSYYSEIVLILKYERRAFGIENNHLRKGEKMRERRVWM